MAKYILYNPYAGGGKDQTERFKELFGEIALTDMTKIENYDEFFAEVRPEDETVICGGDGTLNRFLNTAGDAIKDKKISYYACGSGNDFIREVNPENEGAIALDEYTENLPTVTANGKTYRFINGVGYGIDGYCCEMGDKLRATSDKPVDYTGIAIKGLLFHYKPTGATVTVDGKEYRFEKVWLAPTMNGKYYGGGMIPAPKQKRTGDTLSVMLFHGTGKIRSLLIFPSIFKGEHVKHKKNITVLSGKEITVRFDSPRTLQIDGETIVGVSEYTAKK